MPCRRAQASEAAAWHWPPPELAPTLCGWHGAAAEQALAALEALQGHLAPAALLRQGSATQQLGLAVHMCLASALEGAGLPTLVLPVRMAEALLERAAEFAVQLAAPTAPCIPASALVAASRAALVAAPSSELKRPRAASPPPDPGMPGSSLDEYSQPATSRLRLFDDMERQLAAERQRERLLQQRAVTGELAGLCSSSGGVATGGKRLSAFAPEWQPTPAALAAAAGAAAAAAASPASPHCVAEEAVAEPAAVGRDPLALLQEQVLAEKIAAEKLAASVRSVAWQGPL